VSNEHAFAFAGDIRIADGAPGEVAVAIKARGEIEPQESILIFAEDGRQIDFDLRGSAADVMARLGDPPKGRGRPKLGVMGREVTLLPRHWEWLQAQPGGASVALRKLVEEAMRSPGQQARSAREATYRFMSAIAGDRPGFEEAARALFAGDGDRFRALIATWPADIADQAAKMAEPAFEAP